MEPLNIVALIETNPITKLSGDYNNKLIVKIKNTFSEFEQQLFLSSFYCYLNYHPTNDFIIDLDDVWKWMGFCQKQRAKELLEKYFVIDKDYKCLLTLESEQKKGRGGHNIKKYMLNIKTFKSMCLKAGTKKADEIHDYYLKMEEIIQEVINEESMELKKQLEQQSLKLEQQTLKLEHQKEKSEKEKELLVEKTLIEQFPLNTQCIYYGKIDNKSMGQAPRVHNETLIKFGQSNNLAERIRCHKKNFINFRLVAAFKVKNKIEIENAIKKHPMLKRQMRILTVENPDYKDENYREILALNEEEFTLEKIDGYIREIITQNEYNVENYNRLVEKNNQLEDTIRNLENTIKEKNSNLEKTLQELHNFKPDITNISQQKIASQYAICKYGYFLYAFEIEPMRFKCSIVRQKDYDFVNKNLLELHSQGQMKYSTKVTYPFLEKIMIFLLKQNFTCIATNTFEGIYPNIKKILDITVKVEKMLVEKSVHLDDLYEILDGKLNISLDNQPDPEEPKIKKSKRSIDQINKDTGEVIKTYESIEAAGRSLGLTTGTAVGIALREKRICQGFLWRYSGISKEEQYAEQPVIKVCCSTGKKHFFTTIADASKDANISPPALRQRILTKVHTNGFHWIFDKNATHYT
jgi:hypothetical protein